MIEELAPLNGRRVLDMGTGTGILSIATIFLGASQVIAFDIDPEAARVCVQNACLNDVQDTISVFCGTIESLGESLGCIATNTGKFDLILANIYGDIILEHSRTLASLVEIGGHIIMAGVDFTDSTTLRKNMSGEGLSEMRCVFMEDYVTQVWHLPSGQ